jgi:hypothetical protein
MKKTHPNEPLSQCSADALSLVRIATMQMQSGEADFSAPPDFAL